MARTGPATARTRLKESEHRRRSHWHRRPGGYILGKLLATLAVAGLTFSASGAPAFHEDSLPPIASAEDLPSGWVSFTITTDGTKFAMDVGANSLTGPGQVGFAQYKDDGTFQGAFIFTAFPRKTGVQVDVEAPTYPVHFSTIAPEAGGLFALGVTFNDPQFGAPFVGTTKAVLWWAGAAKFSWQVRAAGNTTIDAQLAEPRAYLYTSQDFNNRAYVQAHAYADGTSAVGAHAQVQGDLPLDVHNNLIGFYTYGLSSSGALSVTTPKGEQSCSLTVVSSGLIGGSSCLFVHMTGSQAAGPGSYTLHATTAGAGLTGAFEDIWFGGADARLPE